VRDGDHNRLPDEEIVQNGGEGVRYLRAQDLQDGTITAADPVYITRRYYESIPRSHIRPGYLLFSIMGSVGNQAIVPNGFPAATANRAVGILAPKSENPALTRFLFQLFQTDLGTQLYERIKKGGLQKRTNLADVGALKFPLVPDHALSRILAAFDAAFLIRQRKLQQADALLSSLDAFLLDRLGLTLPEEQENKAFAVRRLDLVGRRMDAPAYKPFFAKGHPPKTPIRPLLSLAKIDPPTGKKPSSETTLVPYVGLPECELTEIREVIMRPYSDVKGRSAFKTGDILFARIEPSVFNKKYVLADDLKGHEYAFTSTEFYVVRPFKGVNRDFLYSMFFCSFVFAQVRGKTTGSSGRRRIDPDLFAHLMIPEPSKAIQDDIAKEVVRRRMEARRLREEVAREWEAAKARFEARLLGEKGVK
jgi:type I restriction enzyme, S subunit